MASYGVNVPPGVPVFKLDDVLPAAKKMADDSGQVCSSVSNLILSLLLHHHTKQGSESCACACVKAAVTDT